MWVWIHRQQPKGGLAIALVASLFLLLAPSIHAEGLKEASALGTGAEAMGLVDEFSYVSPQFANDVSWTLPWEADLGSMATDPGERLDRLSLVTDNARFQMFLVAAEHEPPESYLARFLDYRMNEDPAIEVVQQGHSGEVYWVAYRSIEEGDTVLDLVEIRLVNRAQVVQVVEVLAWENDFDASFDLAMQHIDVDGDAPFSTVSGWPMQRDGLHANVQR